MKNKTKSTYCLKSLCQNVVGSFSEYYLLLFVAAIASSIFFLFSLFDTVSSIPDIRVETIVKEVKVNYSKYPKILVFVGDKGNRGKGKLVAVNTKEGSLDGAWDAISGVGGREDQRMSGPIPSQPTVNVIHYTVHTSPLTLSNPGIAGKFYKINPHLITIRGQTRGDFGIHADRNVPGTAGCVGIESEVDWQAFKALMADYKESGLKEVPLLVSYR
ncbi:hypothetical protein [Crocosphaera sp.]|uniref:hypothetical protein n=1 Tax=Crocosphaera sp. TaxID=2729996 RepID=UPI00260236B5|nr:hypothetical protein [Crocosphaera sp.]MDJ0581757.1 hypothetical protein [Crocosphaera sp.]